MALSTPIDPESKRSWWTQLTGYQWFVFIIASLAWFFDCMDQRLFSLARIPALKSMLSDPLTVQAVGKNVTALFLIGWGIGGMIFGVLGDRYGRSKMLTVSVLTYSLFTCSTFFSHTAWQFAACRCLTGIGIGGVFGLAVALIAETVTPTARSGALGTLQVLSTIGNICAGLIKGGIDALATGDRLGGQESWRWLFLVGAVPACLFIFVRKSLKEPEPWLQLKREGRLPTGSFFSSYSGLLKATRWRRNLVVGAILAATGVVGLWAIGEYAVDLQRSIFTTFYAGNGYNLAGPTLVTKVNSTINFVFVLNMIGAALGMSLFTWMCGKLGRKKSFLIGFLAALVVTSLAYWKMNSPTDAMWMMPLMGAVQLGPLAGFSIYLPELFPSRLRSTGISFCYNIGRFAAAGGSFFSSRLSTDVYGKYKQINETLPARYSAMTMCSIFLIGVVILIWAPETKDKPLPEE